MDKSFGQGGADEDEEGARARLLGSVKAWQFMNDTGAYIRFKPQDYSTLLREKATDCLNSTAKYLRPNVHCSCVNGSNGFVVSSEGYSAEVYPSVATFYRSRCRLGVDIHPTTSRLCFVMWKHGVEPSKRTYIQAGEAFLLVSPFVNHIMQHVLCYFEDSPGLRSNLEMAHFLASSRKDVVISLFYSRPVLESWSTEMEGFCAYVRKGNAGAKRIGYLVKVKNEKENPNYWTTVRSSGDMFVTEEYRVKGRQTLTYKQTPGSFSNPNRSVCEATLSWLYEITLSEISGFYGDKAPNLLELYCGNGNHTVALAPSFHHVVAVDINCRLVELAKENLEANGIRNVTVLAAQSQKFCKKLLRSHTWRVHTPDGEQADIDFSVAVVDPPRRGLDTDTVSVLQRYDHVLYISCNPAALRENLEVLGITHLVARFAVFDHFPYTNHLECGVYLRRKDALSGIGSGQASGKE